MYHNIGIEKKRTGAAPGEGLRGFLPPPHDTDSVIIVCIGKGFFTSV